MVAGLYGVSVGGFVEYLQIASDDYKYATYPGYALFRASVTQRWQTLLDLSLTLGCDNLINYMTPIIEQGASLSPGRSYFVSLSLNY